METSHPIVRPDYQLSDSLWAPGGAIFLTGTQALVRLMLMQRQRDAAAGLDTRGFISGYRGSPLGMVVLAVWKSGKKFEEAGLRVLPAINDMTEVAKTRIAARRMHVPMSIFVVLAMLTLVGVVFGGYGMASRQSRSTLHSVGFAAVMTLALYLILDLEYPRFGFIRLDATDQILYDLRRSMQ